MSSKDRDYLGRFKKGRKYTLEEKKEAAENIKKWWAEKGSLAQIKADNPYIFNSWRGLMYTQNGKECGISDEWRDFKTFFDDVSPTYQPSYKLHRIDTTLPFSKDNFIWVTPHQATMMNNCSHRIINYKGKDITLKEASIIYDMPYTGIVNRYQKHKDDYTTEEIIFGKKSNRLSKIPKDAKPKTQSERNKASKMISSYKCKDKKCEYEPCDIDIDWMIKNIIHKPCTYCGDTHLIGCDRIDNNKGHIKSNVVPCCYTCNVARGNNFSYQEMLVLGETIRKIKNARKNQ